MGWKTDPPIALAIALLAFAGCTSARTSPRGVAPAAASSESPLSKIKTGMSFEQVVEILGPPTSQRQHLTGHAFNPFALGTEAQTTEFRYPRLGRVLFAGPDYHGGGAEVIAVEVDAGETGYQ